MTVPISLLTEEQAAAELHISPRTLRELRAKGKIRYVRPSPRKVFYRADDVAEYLETQTLRDEPACPSTNPRKARSSTSTSNSKVIDIMDRLAARPGGMPKGMRPTTGGRSR